MPAILLKGAILLILAYVAGRGVGYLLGRKDEAAPKPKAQAMPELEAAPEPAVARPEPELEVVAAPPVVEAVPIPEAAPLPVAAVAKPTKKAAEPAAKARTSRTRAQPVLVVSPLAAMTPAEIEAAVDKAGPPAEPIRLKAAENGGPDALLDITGIGPVNEVQLHALGIYHFRQIAAWTPENIKWVAERIKFPTRIVRENWMKQAAEFEKAKRG